MMAALAVLALAGVLRFAGAATTGQVLVGQLQDLKGPMGVTLTDVGLVVVDTDNHRVLLCPSWQQDFQQSVCKLVAGTGSSGFEASELRTPYTALAQISDAGLGLIIADTHNHRVQFWAPGASEGITLVGGPGFGAPGYDGPGELEFPTGLAMDEVRGFLFVADTGHHRVVRYPIDLAAMSLGAGITVAGTSNVSGSVGSLLDNPTAIAYRNDRLYVADARNSRVMTWLVRPELVDAEVSARRLSSIDDFDDNETSDVNASTTSATQTSTTTRSTSTITTITVTTTTTYTGPRYMLEMDGFQGRPYGVVAAEDSIYVADADGCMVWKKLYTGEKSVVVGSACGGSLNQIFFPGGIGVEQTGAIVIADSRNNRVIRFGPEPLPLITKCTLGGFCEVTLRQGLPTRRSRLALVKRDVRSVCGGRCIVSGLGGGTWVSVPASEPPYLSVMTYKFGVAGYGETMRDYVMCFGPEGLQQEVDAGNCSSMPYEVGLVSMLPFLDTGAGAECVTGAPCTIELDGYGIPSTIVVAAVLDSAYGSGTVCGTGSTQNFQGFRSFVLNNPGTLVALEEPYLSEGNRTAIVRVVLGEAISYGSQLLCVCYEGNSCVSPSRFKEPAGYLKVRSALPSTVYCRFSQNCILNVTGRYLRDTDTAVLTSTRTTCSSLSFQDALRLNFGSPAANASEASVSALSENDGENFALFDVGLVQENGLFKICYCASYDGEDADTQLCSSAAEFTHEGGRLAVMRVDQQDYECAMGRNCSLAASGLFMSALDVLLDAGPGTVESCGSVVPQEAANLGGIFFQQNFFLPQASGAPDPNSSQLFELVPFAVPGPRQLCFCSNFDEDPDRLYGSIGGPCNDKGEFFQPLGTLTIRGPVASVLSCAADAPCTVTVTGSRLAADDLLQVCPQGSSCGNSTACSAAGPNARAGPLLPAQASASSAIFELGSLPLGSYVMCYCAPGTGGTAEISCQSPEDLDMPAGELRVRGVPSGQLFECAEFTTCQLTVAGFDLLATDAILALPISSQCGMEPQAQINDFNPSPRVSAIATSGSSSSRVFRYDTITVPERYKICYCVFASCVNGTDFTQEAGVLIVKGVQKRQYSATCALGERCSVSFNGSGLELATDALKLLPAGFDCGGGFLQVFGDGSNGTQPLLGVYQKGSFLFNTRNFYVQRAGSYRIFYNNFRGWWVFNTDLNTQAEPLAWADGSTYTTPDQVPTGAWQVWITDDITVIGAGYWYGHPSLRVPGSIEPDWAFGLNPTSAMTNVGIDALMSLPYLTSATFDLGPATTAGTYKMCWCPTWDWPESEDLRGGDVDTTPCSSEPEFFVNNGMLAVGYLTIQSRYHCLLGSDCSIGLSLAALVNQRAVLFPGTASCSEADFSLASPWSAARNVSGAQPTANWSVFEFGNASSDGYYQICVCTNYDDGLDGMTCSRFSEFYEAAGSLTVAPEVSLLFEAGIAAVLNVSRGTGLAASDRLLYLPGLQCNVSSAGLSPVASPAQVEATGAWASYGLGAGGTELTSGLWVACLCTDFDGPDADQVACNDLAEFSVPVGKLKVTAVQGPQLQSSVSGSVVLRLTLSRRLSAVDAAVAALGYELAVALETALQRSLETFLGASPVSVRVTGVSPLRGTGSVDVTANFTATLSAASDHLLEVRDFDNASCPVELLEPPWAQAAVPSAPSAELLLGCLRLAEALDAEGAAFQSVLDAELQSVAITGIASPQVVSFGQLQAPVLGYQPAEFRCARGGTCQIRVLAAAGVGTVPALGRLLVSGDSCGLQDGVPNAPAGLIANNPVDASSGTASSVRVVDTGAPELEGSFTLCYCAGGDSGRGACGSDLDYFSQVGTLIVRGPPASFDAFCVVFQDCQVLLRGVELSVWDRLLVKDGGSCYDSSAVGFQASSYFAVNPATLPEWKDSDEWIFDLGAASQTGVYQLCYCASYSATGSVPCQSPSDFTMQAGRLRVRGVQQSGLSFSCVKSSKGDGEAPCTLPVEGTGLMAAQDKMLLVPFSNGSSCGEVAASRSFGVSPNPVALGFDNVTVEPWGAVDAASQAVWQLTRLETPGEYQVCYCPDSPDGSLDGHGACDNASGFYREVGSLTVRGADAGQMFLCVPGNPCDVVVSGVLLSMNDKVRIVGPEDSCSLANPLLIATEQDFIAATEANDTSASFQLGTLRLPRQHPAAVRLCYCAGFNADEEGAACTNASDFTHSAGVVNVPICPAAPAASFAPPVEDIYGDPGDGRFRLFSLPDWMCADLDSRTPADRARYQEALALEKSLGAEGKGGGEAFEDRVVSTRVRQCSPGIPAEVPRAPNLNTSLLTLSIIGGQDSGAASHGLLIEQGFKLHGVPSLSDSRGNRQSCPAWEVEIVAFGCGWAAAWTFGGLLHLVLFFTLAWACLSNQIFYCGAFCKFTTQVDPIVAEGDEEEADQEKEALRAAASVAPAAVDATPSVKAAFAPGVASLEEDEPLRVLLSARTAWILALLRVGTLAVQLVCVLLGAGNVAVLYVLPVLMAVINMLTQVALVAKAWGRSRLWRCLRRPQDLFHSFTLALKLHMDMAIPWLARSHHSELWRAIAVMVTLEMLVQVIIPTFSVLNGLRPGRRRMPAQALWRSGLLNPRPRCPESLETLEVDVKDEKVQGVMEELSPKRRGSVQSLCSILTDPKTGSEMVDQLAMEKLPKGVVVQRGRIGLEGVATSSEMTAVNIAARRNSQVVSQARRKKGRRASVEFLASGLLLQDERTPSKMRRDLEEERAPTKGSMASLSSSRKERQQQREQLVLHMFRMKALEEYLDTPKPRRCCNFTACMAWLASPCLWLGRRMKLLHWSVAASCNRPEAEPPEEFRRRRMVGLWSYLDSSGWYVASLQFRKPAESAGGFQLPHFEDRPACIGAAVGGLDIAVLALALAGIYLPRLSYDEVVFLLLAAITTVVQVGRPGIFHAASSMADDLFVNPEDLVSFTLCAVLLRCTTVSVTGFGCVGYSWLGYLLWTCSVIILELPLLLFCWRSWPILWSIITGKKAAWPGSPCRNFLELFVPSHFKEKDQVVPWMRMQARAAEQVPTVPAGSRAAGQREGERAPELPNLREAAHMVLALRKEQGSETRQLDDPAEPCMAALFQLVEDIVYGVPKDLSERILQDADGEIAKLYNLFVDLNRLPQRQDRKRRVRRLLAAMRYVEQLSSLCQYMGPFTRLSFDELHAQILVELWLARSMVRMDTLLRSRHFRQGCLASRCQLLEAQLPTAPRLWLVHWQTLQGLGRLPKAREFQHLTLATAAHQAHGSQAVVLLAVHRWRSANSVDPQNVTWRQLVTFARWYRSRWGQELEVYFWIDSCCVPELRARLPEQEAETKEDIWVTDDEEVDALPTAPEAAAGRRSSFATLMEKRGLSNLAAWSKATGEKLDDQPDAEDEEEIDEAFQELVAAGRKEDADVAGLDAMLPALFAAMDGVVLCNCHDFEQDAWCRLFLSLAYAFLPSGRLIYEVERNLVHISRAMRARQTEAKKRSEEKIELPNALQLEEAEGNRPAIAEVAEDLAEAANASVEGSPPEVPEVPEVEAPKPAFMEECLDRFLSGAEAHSREELLLAPTDWENLLLEQAEDKGRIQRLTSVALDFPTLRTDTGYRRIPISYGETRALLCSLRGPRPAQRAARSRGRVQTTQEEASSSESEEELPETREVALSPSPPVTYTYKQESEEDSMLELCFTRSKKEEAESFAFSAKSKKPTVGGSTTSFLNATSPSLTRSLQPVPCKLTLGAPPPVLRFHELFVSRAVKLDVKARSASRVRQENIYINTGSIGSGGLAVLSKPLQPRENVCPDAPTALGVTFDVVVEATTPHHEGLAIGFTAQDPDDWPSHRRAMPQTALDLPRSCMVGYGGRWVTEGGGELVQGSWNPAKLARGDVITVVLASEPASLMRALVNGKVVAQRPLAFTGLDVSKPLWGVLDLEGSCVGARLGKSLLS